MIYCELIQRNGNSAVYRFGGLISDMTGEIEHFSDSEPTVIIGPEKSKVAGMWIEICLSNIGPTSKTAISKRKWRMNADTHEMQTQYYI